MITESYTRARQVGALFHWSSWGVLQVQGPDARDFLQRLSTADLRPLTPGSARQTLFLKGDGRMVADAIAVALPDDAFLLITPPSCSQALAELVDRFHFSENLNIVDRRADYHVSLLIAPRRDEMASGIADNGTVVADFNVAGASSWSVIVTPVQKDAELPGDFDAAIVAMGGVVGDEGLFHTLRIEEGIPFYGLDTTDKTIPLEAGLKQAISFTKGCFPGQEIVARINNLGHPANVLVGLKMSDDAPDLPGRVLSVENKDIGRITSAVWSPAIGHWLALGYVKWNQREAGTILQVSGDDNMTATVIELPVNAAAVS